MIFSTPKEITQQLKIDKAQFYFPHLLTTLTLLQSVPTVNKVTVTSRQKEKVPLAKNTKIKTCLAFENYLLCQAPFQF